MKWPFVSRARHDRELKMMREAYEVSSTDLRKRLEHLIQDVVTIRAYPFSKDETEVVVRVRIPKPDREGMIFSPFQREEYWWHLGKKIVHDLKRVAYQEPILK